MYEPVIHTHSVPWVLNGAGSHRCDHVCRLVAHGFDSFQGATGWDGQVPNTCGSVPAYHGGIYLYMGGGRSKCPRSLNPVIGLVFAYLHHKRNSQTGRVHRHFENRTSCTSFGLQNKKQKSLSPCFNLIV